MRFFLFCDLRLALSVLFTQNMNFNTSGGYANFERLYLEVIMEKVFDAYVVEDM